MCTNQVSIRLLEIFVPIKKRRGPHPIRVYRPRAARRDGDGVCEREKKQKSFQSTYMTRTAYKVEPVGKTRMLVLLAYGHKVELDNNPKRTVLYCMYTIDVICYGTLFIYSHMLT